MQAIEIEYTDLPGTTFEELENKSLDQVKRTISGLSTLAGSLRFQRGKQEIVRYELQRVQQYLIERLSAEQEWLDSLDRVSVRS